MNQTCFVCNSRAGITQRNAINIFTDITTLGKSLASLLGEIFERQIPEEGLHSNVICKKCHKMCLEFEDMKSKLLILQRDLTMQFKITLPKHNLNYETYNKPPIKVVSGNTAKIVLPASKLQPLPPNYVFHAEKLIYPKVSSVTSLSKVNKEVTVVGTSMLTQSMKPTNKNTKKLNQILPITETSTPITYKVVDTVSNTMPLTRNNNSTWAAAVPANVLTEAVLTKIDDGSSINNENGEDDVENSDQLAMEIDEDCTIVQIPNNNQSEESGQNGNIEEKATRYFNLSLLQSEESQSERPEQYQLEILQQHDDGDDDDGDEPTIVMSGENGSILRMVAGQKLVYEGGEISLLSDGDSSHHDEDDDNDNEEHDIADSNDESQIELQVSGDEETANAIIAAAQEQGGAFIKVESGEMYRVKSVHSKNNPGTPANIQPLQMVVQEGAKFKCLLCETAGKDPLSLTSSFTGDAEAIKQHLKSEHDARIYICQICNKIIRKRSEYTTHIEEHAAKSNKLSTTPEKGKFHECNICYKKYSSRTLLNEHMNTHSGTRPYSCSVCNKAFASKYTRQAHLKTHLERPRAFKCKQCPKTFFTQQNLNQHEKTHSGVKDFVCSVCQKAFGTQHNLEVHGVVHSGSRPFVCGVCGKAFTRRAEVKDHIRIHTGERPFSCDICGATFTQRSNLHSHKRATHLNDKRHQCLECPKKFKRRRLLDYHIKASHTGERPLQCEVCSATFVYPEHYKKHIRIHSGEKPFVCEVCGKTFNSRDNRNTHRFVHSDKKPYECLVCGAGYMRKQLLYAHMNSSGHLAESIVVNQPRVQAVDKVISSQPHVDSMKVEADKLDTIFEETEELDSGANEKSCVTSESEENTNLKFVLSEDGSGKSTINLVQDEEQPLLTLHNLESHDSSEATIIQSITPEQLEQAQMMASDGNGGMLRLVQVQMNNGTTGWVAIND